MKTPFQREDLSEQNWQVIRFSLEKIEKMFDFFLKMLDILQRIYYNKEEKFL